MPLILTEPASKLRNWWRRKTFFSFKKLIHDFLNKTIRSTCTLQTTTCTSHRRYNYTRRTTTKTEVFTSMEIHTELTELTVEEHSFLSKCRFTISHELNNLCHLNLRDWSKSMGGRGVGHQFFNSWLGVGCSIFSYPWRVGHPFFNGDWHTFLGHVIFNLHLRVGHSVLCQMEGVGHVFSSHHILKCSGFTKDII